MTLRGHSYMKNWKGLSMFGGRSKSANWNEACIVCEMHQKFLIKG
jgi:hypothetical protein